MDYIGQRLELKPAFVRFAKKMCQNVYSVNKADSLTSMVILYHCSFCRISSAAREKNLLGTHESLISVLGSWNSLNRKVGMILEIYTILLWVSEPVYNPSCDDRVLYALVHFRLEFFSYSLIGLQCAHRVHEVLPETRA